MTDITDEDKRKEDWYDYFERQIGLQRSTKEIPIPKDVKPPKNVVGDESEEHY